MRFLEPWMLLGLPLVLLPIIIHLINQWRYQTKPWAAMMFLLAANRMERGYARLRQWLILAMRTLVIAGLVVAISRPLASGLLGWTTGVRPDTTFVILDRSPSMQERSATGESKLETARRQLAAALGTLGSNRWVLIDSGSEVPQEFESLEALVDSPATRGGTSTADIPKMLQEVAEYIRSNRPGATEVWICSDIRVEDWKSVAGPWPAIRQAFREFPQPVRFSLIAYPSSDSANLAIRASDVRLQTQADGSSVLLSIQLEGEQSATDKRTVPIQIEIDGARSEVAVEMVGSRFELRNHSVAMTGSAKRGWGRVSIPADANQADNEFYFVYDEPQPRKTVLVTVDQVQTRAIEIAASIAPNPLSTALVEIFSPGQVDSLSLDDAALLLWQAPLPGPEFSGAIDQYVQRGGQAIFFPPDALVAGQTGQTNHAIGGVRWSSWVEHTEKLMVDSWRGDQDLLAATLSGAALPVGELTIAGHARLEGEVSKLATLSGGDPLLARVPTDKGGIYFCTASAASDKSTLASSGIVLFAAIQRAIERGAAALGNSAWQDAGEIDEATDLWRQLAGSPDSLSTEFAFQAGVYAADERLIAVNRPTVEDRSATVPAAEISRLFEGLDFSRIDDSAGNLSSLVREIWRACLIAMMVAMLVEAALCLPRIKYIPSGRREILRKSTSRSPSGM